MRIKRAGNRIMQADWNSTTNKAKNIIACTRDLLYRFGGEVPRSLEDLTSLAGVGERRRM